jgi:hypothetical protein
MDNIGEGCESSEDNGEYHISQHGLEIMKGGYMVILIAGNAFTAFTEAEE